MKMQIVNPTVDLSARSKKDRVKILTKVFPSLARDAEADCRQIINHYKQVIDGEYWKEVAISEDEYFEKYYSKPKQWFETIRTKLLSLPRDNRLTIGQHEQQQAKAIELAQAPKSLNATPGNPTGKNQHHQLRNLSDNKQSSVDGGSEQFGGSKTERASSSVDSEYLAARIARDRPDILEKMREGEYPSVRAAAVDAGIVKPRKQFTVGPSTTPDAFAGALWEKLDEDFLAQVIAILNEALGA